VFWREIGGNEGWIPFRSFGDNLEQEIAFLAGVGGISQLVDGENADDVPVILDPGGQIGRLPDLCNQVEGGGEGGGMTFNK